MRGCAAYSAVVDVFCGGSSTVLFLFHTVPVVGTATGARVGRIAQRRGAHQVCFVSTLSYAQTRQIVLVLRLRRKRKNEVL